MDRGKAVPESQELITVPTLDYFFLISPIKDAIKVKIKFVNMIYARKKQYLAELFMKTIHPLMVC